MTNPDNVGGLPHVLSACPFCGSPAEIDVWERTALGAMYYVCCTNRIDCRCMTVRSYEVKTVVDAWNRRNGELCRAAPAGGDEKVARFGHHPDPAIDFEIEVESLQSRLFNAKHGLAKVGTQPETVGAVSAAIARAMEFRVGGDESAVRAKAMLRALQSDSAPAGSGEVGVLGSHLIGIANHIRACPEYRKLLGDAEYIERAAALLRKLQQGADGWRPIDSAPKDGRRVLAFAGARPFIARHGRTVGWWDDNDLMRDPTHWRPLPDSPASQGQEGGHG